MISISQRLFATHSDVVESRATRATPDSNCHVSGRVHACSMRAPHVTQHAKWTRKQDISKVGYWEVAGESVATRATGPYGISLSSIAPLQALRFGSRPILSPPQIAYPGLFLPKFNSLTIAGWTTAREWGGRWKSKKSVRPKPLSRAWRIGRARGSW